MTNKEAYEYFQAQGLSMGLAQRFANETTLYELWKAKVEAEAEYFPMPVKQGFNGIIEEVNWP